MKKFFWLKMFMINICLLVSAPTKAEIFERVKDAKWIVEVLQAKELSDGLKAFKSKVEQMMQAIEIRNIDVHDQIMDNWIASSLFQYIQYKYNFDISINIILAQNWELFSDEIFVQLDRRGEIRLIDKILDDLLKFGYELKIGEIAQRISDRIASCYNRDMPKCVSYGREIRIFINRANVRALGARWQALYDKRKATSDSVSVSDASAAASASS